MHEIGKSERIIFLNELCIMVDVFLFMINYKSENIIFLLSNKSFFNIKAIAKSDNEKKSIFDIWCKLFYEDLLDVLRLAHFHILDIYKCAPHNSHSEK